LVEIIDVGIIIAKDVPTDKCILVTISKSKTVHGQYKPGPIIIPPPPPSYPAINPATAAAIAKTTNKFIISLIFEISIIYLPG